MHDGVGVGLPGVHLPGVQVVGVVELLQAELPLLGEPRAVGRAGEGLPVAHFGRFRVRLARHLKINEIVAISVLK